jgi:3-hydroxyacyl-CoA dehydrogenase
MKELRNIVVVGAGMMGNALAQVFAADPGLNLVLKTRALKEDRFDPIISNLDIMIAYGAATETEKKGFWSAFILSPTTRKHMRKPISSSNAIPRSWRRSRISLSGSKNSAATIVSLRRIPR